MVADNPNLPPPPRKPIHETRELSQQECEEAVHALLEKVGGTNVYGVPRGGICVAYLCCAASSVTSVVSHPGHADFIVDDIIDSGRTRDRYREAHPGTPFYALADFLKVPKKPGQWIVFPWEKTDAGADASGNDIVVRLLQYMGEDPDREGLKDTPSRVLKAWKEMTQGYAQDPAAILARNFDIGPYDELVACPFIEFQSVCEHHLLPFMGVAHVGYLPAEANPRVVGLSKMARLVDCYARRLQVQERLTMEIAEAMELHLGARGVAVVIQAKHLCMACRGVKKHKAVMVTSAMFGVFRNNSAARAEFFQLIDLAARSNGA